MQITLKGIRRTFWLGDQPLHALDDIDLAIDPGEYISVMGPSGSGKSTLMNILGCLDRPSGGDYYLDGENVAQMNDNQLADIRNRKVGFIFQSFNLLPRAAALSNVELPLRYSNANGKNGSRGQRARKALESVGLADRIHHRPNELSGGQQQRVAIARSIVTDPAIIMADEPTGNLDSKSGDEVMKLLLNLNKERGVTLIIVTHDPEIAARTDRVITIRDGQATEGS